MSEGVRGPRWTVEPGGWVRPSRWIVRRVWGAGTVVLQRRWLHGRGDAVPRGHLRALRDPARRALLHHNHRVEHLSGLRRPVQRRGVRAVRTAGRSVLRRIERPEIRALDEPRRA